MEREKLQQEGKGERKHRRVTTPRAADCKTRETRKKQQSLYLLIADMVLLNCVLGGGVVRGMETQRQVKERRGSRYGASVTKSK